MSSEFMKATLEMAKKVEIPDDVSNNMLWALAVDNFRRINKLELRAAAAGGAAGLIVAGAALLAAL